MIPRLRGSCNHFGARVSTFNADMAFQLGLTFLASDVNLNAKRRLRTTLVTACGSTTVGELVDSFAPHARLTTEGVRVLSSTAEPIALSASIADIKHLLRNENGAPILDLICPPDPSTLAATGLSPTNGSELRGTLRKVRASTRYTDTKGGKDCHVPSKSRKQKEYPLKGTLSQLEFKVALMSPPEVDASTLEYMSTELVRFSKAGVPLLKMRLNGPKTDVVSFLACGNEALVPAWRPQLAPIFIPSKGRPIGANLNLAAPTALGGPSVANVIIVLEPSDVSDYRDEWPEAVFLILPLSKQAMPMLRTIPILNGERLMPPPPTP